jgi:hypothetical protein
MSTSAARVERPEKLGQGVSVEERRFVMDFGAGGARTADVLYMVEEGLASSSKQLHGVFFKRHSDFSATPSGDWVTVVEVLEWTPRFEGAPDIIQ